MAVGDFAREFAATLAAEGIDLVPNVTVPWLSGKGHLHAGASKIDERVRGQLSQIYGAVGGQETLLAAKRPSRCGIDFQLDERIFLELDEVQHFSSRRLETLTYYEGVVHSLDLPLYERLCTRYRGTADRAWAKRIKNEFDFIGGRTSQRAYLDAARDLIAPLEGATLLRIPAPESNVRLAVERFHKALAESHS